METLHLPNRNITIDDLVKKVGERLQLTCLTPSIAQTNIIIENFSGTIHQNLVGSLNCIHPNRIQVIGTAELTYLQNLSLNAYTETLEKLFRDSPAALLFSNGHIAPIELIEYAVNKSTPVLVSPLSDFELIENLHYFLITTTAERTVLHGVFVEVQGVGVLITGESGIGKSELALALICRGHRLIADDAPEFSQIAPDILSGTCPILLRDFLEVRGLGILNVRAMFGDSAVRRKKELHLIIHLQRMNDAELSTLDRLTGTETVLSIQGVGVPRVVLPVTPGRNLAVLVEAAVRHYTLKLRGYNAAQDFVTRQTRLMKNQT
jgi:HPr kinase/phosphorylase